MSDILIFDHECPISVMIILIFDQLVTDLQLHWQGGAAGRVMVGKRLANYGYYY